MYRNLRKRSSNEAKNNCTLQVHLGLTLAGFVPEARHLRRFRARHNSTRYTSRGHNSLPPAPILGMANVVVVKTRINPAFRHKGEAEQCRQFPRSKHLSPLREKG